MLLGDAGRRRLGRALRRRLPLLRWLPRYTAEDAVGDLVAGLTVGLTLMPQALAYAALAELPSQYGLYSAFAGSLVYILLGGCKEVNIGPTALLSLLTASYTQGTSPDLAVLLCFLSGCVELLCGVLRLGFLVEFISVPVVSGFTSAAAVIIASSQMKGLLGLSFRAHGLLDTWVQLARLAPNRFSSGDLALGLSCIVTLLLLRKLKDAPVSGKRPWLRRALWFVSTGRNALVVLATAATAYALDSHGQLPFLLSGDVQPGLPQPAPPPFEAAWGNRTRPFPELVAHLGAGIAVVPVVAILGNVAIAKAFAAGARVDATQEMITLGACNLVGSFFRSMPVCGSFSRSAVNNASGVRTPLGGLYTGGLVLLALSLLTPYFYYIPRATLAAVIICAVIFMVEAGAVMPIWRSSRRDLVPGFTTFLVCLFFGVEVGIVAGVLVDVAMLLLGSARPAVAVERFQLQDPAGAAAGECTLLTPESGLLFPAADHVRAAAVRAAAGSTPGPLVLDLRHAPRADYTAAQGLRALAAELRTAGGRLLLLRARPAVARVLAPVLGADFLHADSEQQLRDLLAGLQQQPDGKKPEVSAAAAGPDRHSGAETAPAGAGQGEGAPPPQEDTRL